MTVWEDIKTEYITTSISYRKLAEKWGVLFRTLADRGKREAWPTERKIYCDSVVTKTVQKVAINNADANANKLIQLQTAADNLVSVINVIFEDAEQFKRHLVKTHINNCNGESWDVEQRLFEKVDTKAIKDIASALKDLTCVIRSVYDIPTIQEKSAMDIASRRMLLNERKIEVYNDKEIQTGVVILPSLIKIPQ